MAKQWVDITTIDNNTPFTKVRWIGGFTSGGDKWFSEAPGLVTNNMSWGQGNTAAWGWYGGHRMNSGSYTCGFQCDVTGIDTGLTPNVYRTHLKDALRSDSRYYDTRIEISGVVYYEIDFSLWDGAAGKSLYAPYSPMPWNAGEVLVEVGTDPIELDKDTVRFKSTGGTDTVIVTADDNWTAVVSDNWITASTLSGGSGETQVTISAPDYQDTTVNRTGTVVFTSNGNSVTLTVKQSKKVVPGRIGNVYLGDEGATAMYLGDNEVSAMYLGDNLIFPIPEPVVITGATKYPYSTFNPQPGEHFVFATLFADSKWYVPTTNISGGVALASEVTYTNGTITNLPSDLLAFDIEAATGGYYLKQSGTNKYLQLNGSSLSLGSTPALVTFGDTIYDNSGTTIGTSSDAAVCGNGTYMAMIDTYNSGDPSPLFAREFQFSGIVTSSVPWIAKLFKAI